MKLKNIVLNCLEPEKEYSVLKTDKKLFEYLSKQGFREEVTLCS